MSKVASISAHRLPETAFTALASDGGDPAVVRLLREAQRSKHTMLLHAIAEAAEAADPSAGTIAFRAGYELLTRIQATDPGASAWLLGLPHLGGWAHDCLIRLDQGTVPDFAYLACAAADARLDASRSDLRPDPGSGRSVPHWRGTPAVRALADGLAWDVLLVTDDPYLDRYTLPMSTGLSAGELQLWRQRVQSAWEVLVRHHRWAAGPIADGVSVIVPLTPQSDTDLISATSPAAFGA